MAASEGESERLKEPSGREPLEVRVGVVGRAHGVKGEVAVEVRTDEPERRFAAGQILRIEDTTRTLRVVSSRFHGRRLLVRFAEFGDRTAAERSLGVTLVADVDPAERPVDPEEYFDRQLVGLSVRSADGPIVGTVAAVLHLPEQDVLEIDADGARHLVPFVAALVPEVDLSSGEVRLADVRGLLGEGDEN